MSSGDVVVVNGHVNNGASNGQMILMNGEKKDASQIPFIDDEFEELSYILTRRHIVAYANESGVERGGGGGGQGGENGMSVMPAIKEEKILIKSPLKNSFFRKFSSPIKNMSSRRSSQKSQTDLMMTNTTNNTNTNGAFSKSSTANNDEEAGERANLLDHGAADFTNNKSITSFTFFFFF